MLTPWIPQREVLAGEVLTLLAGAWRRIQVAHGELKVWHLIPNGLLYVTYLVVVAVGYANI